MKKRLMLCLLVCALLSSCQAQTGNPNNDPDDNTNAPPVTQVPDATDDAAARIQYYEQLVGELQKEILSLRTEIYVGRVEYEALLEDLLTQTPPKQDGEEAPQSTDFFYVVENGKATVTSYVGKATSVTVPSEINGYAVVAVGDRAFMDRTDVVSVTLPDGVQKLGWFAFSGCVSLQSVELPDSVNVISYGAFDNCPSALTLRCSQNSYAAQYAKSYGIATA